MKNLANCTPREFLSQTVKIKRAAEAWLTATDISNIRKRMPVLPKDMPKKEKDEALAAQAMAKRSAIVDEIAEKHPEETLELMGLMCFVEPENIDDHPMTDYLMALTEMIGSEAVLGFFTSLMKLARTGILRG